MSKWSDAPFLAFEDPDGSRYGAAFSSERDGFTRVTVFGEKFRLPPDPRGVEWDIWAAYRRFKTLTGELVDDITKVLIPNGGKLVVSAVNLLEDYDVPQRRAKFLCMNVFEYRKLLAGGGAQPALERWVTTIEVQTNAKPVVDVQRLS